VTYSSPCCFSKKDEKHCVEFADKRRKDIASLSGVQVDETGIGSGEDTVPVESVERDWLLLPLLFVCAFTVSALLAVLAVQAIRSRQRFNHASTANIDLLSSIDGKPSMAYQELCRQRMGNQQEARNNANNSKTSSTSSWCDETTGASTDMDISTGHAILAYLQKQQLDDDHNADKEWSALSNYSNPIGAQSCSIAIDAKNGIDASSIHDSDPREATHLAARTPHDDEQQHAFWQLIWQKGCVVVVNLSNQFEQSEDGNNYWPSSGSLLHGTFEIHLVSEHIWSECYLVRSFYLKNLATNETRTVTQFHFISWPHDSTPSTTKALLEFRRKVNKSYRGRCSPILVHSEHGCGRTGAYILLDMTLDRISKGVKELDMAASVEHLRDQRNNMVANVDQFKYVLSCVADEVSSVLKQMPL